MYLTCGKTVDNSSKKEPEMLVLYLRLKLAREAGTRLPIALRLPARAYFVFFTNAL